MVTCECADMCNIAGKNNVCKHTFFFTYSVLPCAWHCFQFYGYFIKEDKAGACLNGQEIKCKCYKIVPARGAMKNRAEEEYSVGRNDALDM